MNSMTHHHAVLRYTADTANFELPTQTQETTVEVIRQDKFGISDARTLIERANRMPDSEAASQQIIVVFETITVEAQQALLKIIEEPPKTTNFIFVVPTGTALLPTLLSRFSVALQDPESEISTVFTEFLDASVRGRMEMVEAAIKNKETNWQQAIKQGLVSYLHGKGGDYTVEQLSALEYVAKTLLTRGASNKFLLEELSLTL